MYQGHCNDGSSIQKHSAGSHYPYVIGKTHGGTQPWYVQSPNGDVARFTLGDAAVAFAENAAKIYH